VSPRSGPRVVPGGELRRLMSERELEAEVIKLCKDWGWLRYHTHRSQFSPAGFPDECLVRPPRLIFAELKRQDGKLEALQERWLEALGEVPGVEVYTWRPSDLETIDRILAPEGMRFH
jgi:hypothetical protein